MNLSLKTRISISFIIANVLVLSITFFVFYFLNGLNKEIESITVKSNRVALLTDEIRISAVSILKYQRRVLVNFDPELVNKITTHCESFTAQLQTLDSLYQEPEVKKVVAKMLSYVDSLKLVLGKAAYYNRDTIGISSIGELADKILETFSEFQDIQYFQSVERDKKIREVINDTKRNMMITLIIGFLGTIILGLVVPAKISLPFKKIKDAVRELQDNNFDVSIYYAENDEIGEIAQEMNKMIHSFKIFDELRADKILLEKRKFDVLANMVKKPVLVASADGHLIYMNNRLYSLLQVRSEDVLDKPMNEAFIPLSIIQTYDLAIKRRSKIENAEILIHEKKEIVAHSKELTTEENVEVETIFSGYANVIPIRGKESSLDYYIMVLSQEVFT